MNIQQAFIVPAAGVAVIISSVAALGPAFGILVGIGMAAIAAFTGGLALSGQESSQHADSPSTAQTGTRVGVEAHSPLLQPT